MKLNQNSVSIEVLKSLESDIKELLNKPEVWSTLDVDYFPPRVERLKPKYTVGSRVKMMGEFLGTITKVTPTHIHCISDPTKHNPVPQECIDTIEEFENLAELIQDND